MIAHAIFCLIFQAMSAVAVSIVEFERENGASRNDLAFFGFLAVVFATCATYSAIMIGVMLK